MVPVVARDTLRVSPGLMGILISAHDFGSLVGSFLVASAGTIRYHGRLYMAGSMLTLVAVLAFSLSRSYSLSLLVVAVAGLGNAGFSTMQMSLTMLLPKDEMRGAALGAMSLGIGGGPLGMLITGAVASVIGTTETIGLNAVLGIVSLALIALLVPSLRQRIIADEQL
jgi:predicted MFS family arabinose efflux permease